MSYWTELELTESPEQVPKLLIKAEFRRKGYTIFLTDLTYIWKEELDLDAIIERATEEESPIEVNQHDTLQLSILLDNIQRSVQGAKGSTCHVARHYEDGIALHTTSILPEPLDALRWKFYLRKDKAIALRDELISPLLVHSQIQHRRIASLVKMLQDKDKAISRLLDQYESLNLDLATAYPVIGGQRSGRKPVRREQAMKHVPALQPFEEARWEESSKQIEEDDFSSAAFFQEAIPHHHVSLATSLRFNDEDEVWWTSIPKRLPTGAHSPKRAAKSSKKMGVHTVDDETTEDDAEEEEAFEEMNPSQRDKSSPPLSSPPKGSTYGEIDEDETTDDEDEDLDALIKTQSQSQSQKSQIQRPPPSSSLPQSSQKAIPSRGKGFRVGGNKAKKTPQESREISSFQIDQVSDEDEGSKLSSTATKPTRKPFRIGGKQRGSAGSSKSTRNLTQTSKNVEDVEMGDIDNNEDVLKEAQSRTEEPAGDLGEQSQVPDSSQHAEETMEEKAERRRRELKRKNEELAKKQAPKKHKKRF